MIKRLVTVIGVLVCATLCAPAASASDAVTMTASVNGRDVSAATATEPVALEPGQWADIAIELTNTGDQAVEVRRVTLSGSVLGLTFYSYATSVDFVVAPGATESLRYRLDLADLDGQATGLLGGQLAVSGSDRATVATLSTVTDVRGSLLSVYGLFGIALVILTVLSLLDVALALARHRMSANRWQRGLRFLAPGVGVGLVLVFSASVARLWVPDLGLWLVVASLTAVVSFALGYFSPTPDDDEDDDFDDDFDDFDEEPALEETTARTALGQEGDP